MEILSPASSASCGALTAVRRCGSPRTTSRPSQGAAIEHVDLQESRARLRAADAARTAYVRRLYRVDPANPTLYHLMIDTTAVALQDAVELILSASRSAKG